MEKRKPLTKREFGFLIIRQGGLCGCGCGRKLDFSKPGLVTDEHLNSLFSLGTNELDNRALWLTVCSVAKTSAEAPGRAKVRRIEQGKTQADRRQNAKATGKHKPIAGAGFRGSRKFNGEIKWKERK
jgi:hypothetical protein